MLRTLLQAKLHGVKVTHADLHYEGSCGIDSSLLRASGICRNQYVDIYNLNNGNRFSTYVIAAETGSGQVALNGAAARMALIGDILIVCAFGIYEEQEVLTHRPIVVLVDENNRPINVAGTQIQVE